MSNLIRHKRTAHNNLAYKCDDCEVILNSKETLKTHIDSVHLNIRHKCPDCDFEGQLISQVNQHIRRVHENVKYECSVCSFKTGWKSIFKLHCDKHNPIKDTKKCKICDESVETDKMINHLRKHKVQEPRLRKKNNTQKFDCSICGIQIYDKGTLKQHMEGAHINFRLNCHLCDYTASTKRTLGEHIQNIHVNKKIKCDLCNFESTYKKSIKRHKRRFHLSIK